jgi:transposase-like protein
MANKPGILGSIQHGAEMLESEAVREMFTLQRLGWGAKRIARELGIARNTVRDWLRKGSNRQYAGPARAPVLAEHFPWLRERFRAGVRNGDVFRQELAARGVIVSLRTVNRALKPLRREVALSGRATVRFETAPGAHDMKVVDEFLVLAQDTRHNQGQVTRMPDSLLTS